MSKILCIILTLSLLAFYSVFFYILLNRRKHINEIYREYEIVNKLQNELENNDNLQEKDIIIKISIIQFHLNSIRNKMKKL